MISSIIAMSLFTATATSEYSVLAQTQQCDLYEPKAIWQESNQVADELVLVIAMGERSSGGYYFEPKSTLATFDNGTITLDIDYVEPEAGMMTTMALTSPCISVALPAAWQPAESVQLNGMTVNIEASR